MEMNFPHKDPLSESEMDRTGEELLQSDYAALMAHVIARQSLSHSARKVFAHEMELATAIASNQGRSLQNRIRFFAGQVAHDQELDPENLFIRGHFRPDLTEQSIAGEGA